MLKTEIYRNRLARYASQTLILLVLFSGYNVSPSNALSSQNTVSKDASLKQVSSDSMHSHITIARKAVLAIGLIPKDATYSGLSKEQTKAAVVIHKFFGEKNFAKAVSIAWCESRLNPKAVNRSNRNKTSDWGLFQLNDGGTMQRLGVKSTSAVDPVVNVKAAVILHEDRGWKPWVCQWDKKRFNKSVASANKTISATSSLNKKISDNISNAKILDSKSKSDKKPVELKHKVSDLFLLRRINSVVAV